MSSISLKPLTTALLIIETLRARGWRLADQWTGIVCNAPVASPDTAYTTLQVLEPSVANLTVRGTYGDFHVTLKLVQGQFEVVDVPEGNLERFFDDRDEKALAAQLHDRDTEAALQLPLVWQARAELDLGCLVDSGPGTEMRVVLSQEWLTAAIEKAGPLAATALIPPPGHRRVYVATDGPNLSAHFGAVSFAGIVDALMLPPRVAPLPGERAAPLEALLEPAAFIPFDAELGGPWERIARVVACAFVASTWHRLANSITLKGSGIEVVGFKRVNPLLPRPSDMTEELIAGTRRVYDWAFQDLSPDRLLAVRQVVSLYDRNAALHQPADVLESAEMVFVGLRTHAVADALQNMRDAQARAAESVRQSLKSVQDMLKTATERLFASLAAVAAVLIANATPRLADHVARELLLAVALYLLVLAVAHALLEGPLLSLPLRTIKNDLAQAQPTLNEDQLNRATGLESMHATKSRVLVVRWLVPIVYILLAAAIGQWGFPEHFR